MTGVGCLLLTRSESEVLAKLSEVPEAERAAAREACLKEATRRFHELPDFSIPALDALVCESLGKGQFQTTATPAGSWRTRRLAFELSGKLRKSLARARSALVHFGRLCSVLGSSDHLYLVQQVAAASIRDSIETLLFAQAEDRSQEHRAAIEQEEAVERGEKEEKEERRKARTRRPPEVTLELLRREAAVSALLQTIFHRRSCNDLWLLAHTSENRGRGGGPAARPVVGGGRGRAPGTGRGTGCGAAGGPPVPPCKAPGPEVGPELL